MKQLKIHSILPGLLLLMALATAGDVQAQFLPDGKPLTIIVSDGTEGGRDSEVVTPRDVPQSYDQIPGQGLQFDDPIRPLGMKNCIQAAAFLERPDFGIKGYMLVFTLNDSIGGKQATLVAEDGREYKGVYRLIRQKLSADEPVPRGMTNFTVSGTFFLLGIS